MTHPGRKRPWYARLLPNLATATQITAYAADVPDGFTRQVSATFTMDEPGKGSGPNTSQREVVVRFNPADARRFGIRMIADAQLADAQNATAGNGDQYTDAWPPQGTPDPDRRMNEEFAEQLAELATLAGIRLKQWSDNHPDIADYRVEEALTALSRAGRLLGYLRDDTDPPGDAARAELAKSPLWSGEH